jgi:hypothetical protein
MDSSDDAPVEDSPAPVDVDADCQGLYTDLDAARVAAKKCLGTVGDCTLREPNECNCQTWVETFAGQADYRAKVNAIKGSGCPLNCPAKCADIGDGAAGFCLPAGGSSLSCSP